MKLRFTCRAEIETASGVVALGSEQLLRNGENHIVLTLPEGRIRSITASAFFPIPDAERIFMNGYQTWTYCPEYDRSSRIRGLHGIPQPIVSHYALDRYGDYDFVDYPNRRGLTHGVSYCYFRSGARFRLLGSLDETPGYTLFSLTPCGRSFRSGATARASAAAATTPRLTSFLPRTARTLSLTRGSPPCTSSRARRRSLRAIPAGITASSPSPSATSCAISTAAGCF